MTETERKDKQFDPHQDPGAKFPNESRSLYIGHLPEGTTFYDLCKVAHEFGPLELVRIVANKKCAFLNFIHLNDAKKMMASFSRSAAPHPEGIETLENVLTLLEKPVRIGWSETKDISDDIKHEVEVNDASRRLFVFYGSSIHNNENDESGVITAAELADVFRTYGNIENIVMKPKKHIAFVNMTSLNSAISIFNDAQDDALLLRGEKMTVKYGEEEKALENYSHDRNHPRNQPFSYNGEYLNPKHQQQGSMAVHGITKNFLSRLPLEEPKLPPGWMESIDEKTGCKYYYNTQEKLTQWEHPVTLRPSPPIKSPPNVLNFDYAQFQASRAVILQNLPPNVDYAMLCTLGRQHGMMESIRLHADKQMGFINYVDGASAISLFNYAQNAPIVMEGNTIRVGWAKEVPMKPYLYEAIVQDGANRSVYLRDVDPSFTEPELKEEFEMFSGGEVESIILRPQDKPYGFVNFIDIVSAKKVVDVGKKNGGLYETSSGKLINVSYVNAKKTSFTMRPQRSFSKYSEETTQTRNGSGSSPCRSVIISGFPTETTLTDIGILGEQFGPIESLHLNVDRNHAFINFVEPRSANRFMVSSKTDFCIRGKDVRVGYGKSVTMRPELLKSIKEDGASRSLVAKMEQIQDSVSLEQELKDMVKDLCRESDVENIIVKSDQNCAVLNFSSIQIAKKVLSTVVQTEQINGQNVTFDYVQLSRV